MIDKKEVVTTLIAICCLIEDMMPYGTSNVPEKLSSLSNKIRNIINEPHLHFNVNDI